MISAGEALEALTIIKNSPDKRAEISRNLLPKLQEILSKHGEKKVIEVVEESWKTSFYYWTVCIGAVITGEPPPTFPWPY